MTQSPAQYDRSTRHRRRRPGSAYLLVIGMCVLIMILGVAAVAAARIRLRSANNSADILDARVYAQSAVDVGRLWMKDANWRAARPQGVWATSQPVGQGFFSLQVTGTNWSAGTDPVDVVAWGFKGRARHKLQVRLTPDLKPYTALACAGAAKAGISANGGTLTSDQTLSTNGAASSGTAVVNANVEAASISITGGTGTRTILTTPRTYPDPTTVFDYYTTNGTAISISSIPLSGQNRQCTNRLFSPNSNPFGATNPLGIYVIDCVGQNIQISTCRVVGTLVILNPGGNSAIQNSNNFATNPAKPNYPVLLVKGDMLIKMTATALADNSSTGINYNPPGTPYAGANPTTDTTYTTTYPSEIRGLVYVSGNLSTNSSPTITGNLIVEGTFSPASTTTINYDASSYTTPPPGFYAPPPMKPVAGTWQQITE